MTGVIAIPLGPVLVIRVAIMLSVSVLWLIRYSQMAAGVAFGGEAECEPLSLTVQLGQLATYAYLPFGVMAIGSGWRPVATVAGDFGVRAPVAGLMLYCETAFDLPSTT